MGARYLLARRGETASKLDGLTRRDCPDGYTEFRNAAGECKAVVMTSLLATA